MDPAVKLISVRGIKKLSECGKMPRQFVDYLKELGVVSGTKVPIVKRDVWKYTPQEAAVIQSVWYFRGRGFDLQKSIELAKKSQERREHKLNEDNLFAELPR
jgi:hypothetical protein